MSSELRAAMRGLADEAEAAAQVLAGCGQTSAADRLLAALDRLDDADELTPSEAAGAMELMVRAGGPGVN